MVNPGARKFFSVIFLLGIPVAAFVCWLINSLTLRETFKEGWDVFAGEWRR